jgi:hypothetical protein
VAAEVRFLLDGEVIAIDAPDAGASVLDLLRYRLRRTGAARRAAPVGKATLEPLPARGRG